MASVRILRRAPLKESVLSIEISTPIHTVISDLDAEINSLQHFRTLASALNSDLPRILSLVTIACGTSIYKQDVENVKMVRDREGEKKLRPKVILRKEIGDTGGLINYEGIDLNFKTEGNVLEFELVGDVSEG